MWRDRVEQWRASGQRLAEFCRDKDYTASGLGYWIRRLDSAGSKSGPKAKELPLVRVVRGGRGSSGPATSAPQTAVLLPTPPGSDVVVIEVGAVRVQVPAKLDSRSLESVVSAVVRSARAGAS